jgi:hypothetical protein
VRTRRSQDALTTSNTREYELLAEISADWVAKHITADRSDGRATLASWGTVTAGGNARGGITDT